MRISEFPSFMCGVGLVLTVGIGCAQTPTLVLQLQGLGTDWSLLTVSNSSATNFVIEVSEDLQTWKSHTTVDTHLDAVKVVDRDGGVQTGGHRFYRVTVPGLRAAQQHTDWLAHGIASYTFHFEQLCFCLPWTPRRADVTVIEGRIVSVTNVVYYPSPDPFEQPPDHPDLSQFMTIEDLFGRIQRALVQPVDVLAVSYDPLWSFPRRIAIDEVVQMVDDEIEYAVSDLRPLASTSVLRDQRANPSLQPTATSHGLRQDVTLNSITPSLWLLSHPSCRRSTLELAVVSSRVAVAELFR